MRAGDDMRHDKFGPHASNGLGACFHGGFDSGNVALDHDRDVTSPDALFANNFDIGRFTHDICSLNDADESLGFDQPNCVFVTHNRHLSFMLSFHEKRNPRYP